MSFCGVTGRSGQFNPHTSENVLTGRWQGPVTPDRTRPVALNPYWNLTVLDRTLNPQGPVSTDPRVQSQIPFSGTLLESTGRCLSASGHLTDPASGHTERCLLDQMN